MIGQRRVPDGKTELSDAAALQELSEGQISALGVLYDRYQGSVASFIRRATNDASDVEDLVQATFMTAAKTAVNFDGRQSCPTVADWHCSASVIPAQARLVALGACLARAHGPCRRAQYRSSSAAIRARRSASPVRGSGKTQRTEARRTPSGRG